MKRIAIALFFATAFVMAMAGPKDQEKSDDAAQFHVRKFGFSWYVQEVDGIKLAIFKTDSSSTQVMLDATRNDRRVSLSAEDAAKVGAVLESSEEYYAAMKADKKDAEKVIDAGGVRVRFLFNPKHGFCIFIHGDRESSKSIMLSRTAAIDLFPHLKAAKEMVGFIDDKLSFTD